MCGIGGIVSLDREIPFNIILDMLESMKMRGTEHGAGFAAYSPTENGLIRFRFFAEENDINVLTTRLNEYIHLGKVSKIAQLNRGLAAFEALIKSYPPSDVYKLVHVFQAARHLEVWKSIGWPHSVAEVYSLWTKNSYAWLGHTRYPTNSPGFKPWLAHPFSYGEVAVVHNGDLSSYGINKRFVEYVLGIENFTGNDSEIIAYLLSMFLNDGLSVEETIETLISGEKLRWAKLDGPFAVIFIYGTSKGPIFGAFVDKHHLRPLYVSIDSDVVYVASEAGAIKSVNPRSKPRMVRGGGFVVVYPDGNKVVKGLSEYKEYDAVQIPIDAIDADDYKNSVLLNKAIELSLARNGYAHVINLKGHRYVANGLGPGRLELFGVVGNASLYVVEGVEARIYGLAQEDLGDCAMDSTIVVYGSVGDSAGQAMRSGGLYITGSAGNRLGVQMKGGVIVVKGSVGDYLGEYMSGGTILVLGSVGRYIASGMVGGKIFIKGCIPLSTIGKAPPRTLLMHYIEALTKRGLQNVEEVKALKDLDAYDLMRILGPEFEKLSKLWGVLHVGYPIAECRYVSDDEKDEIKRIVEEYNKAVETVKEYIDVEELFSYRFTVIKSAKYRYKALAPDTT
jgi:glutamate synthase domain-containing protein 1/glutamate synthase domain-containing protein 3